MSRIFFFLRFCLGLDDCELGSEQLEKSLLLCFDYLDLNCGELPLFFLQRTDFFWVDFFLLTGVRSLNSPFSVCSWPISINCEFHGKRTHKMLSLCWYVYVMLLVSRNNLLESVNFRRFRIKLSRVLWRAQLGDLTL